MRMLCRESRLPFVFRLFSSIFLRLFRISDFGFPDISTSSLYRNVRWAQIRRQREGDAPPSALHNGWRRGEGGSDFRSRFSMAMGQSPAELAPIRAVGGTGPEASFLPPDLGGIADSLFLLKFDTMIP